MPKKDPGKFRLIHNLSYPFACSVNAFIPRDFSAVQYELLDQCLDIVASVGPGCLMAKADLADAYRILKVAQHDYRFLGFTFKDKFYFDKVLPMGLSSSCAQFEQFSSAIQWVLTSKLHVRLMSHILDDFMFFGAPGSTQCAVSLQAFTSLADSIGLPIKHAKTVHPTTSAELHGILVDSTTMMVSIPPDKLLKATSLIGSMYRCKSVTLQRVQSLAGLLHFFLRAIPAGRPFLRRLYDLMSGKRGAHRHINLTAEARKDLAVWRCFLTHFSGSKLIKRISWTTDSDWRFFSDACGFGYAAVLGGKWLQGRFPPEWMAMSIAVKELVPIYLAFRLWGPALAHSKILIRCDNQSVCHVLTNHTSKDKVMMKMLRFIVLLCLHNHILISAMHVPGRHNVVADLLSRYQVAKARKVASFLEPDPQPIPDDWLPWLSRLLPSL